MPTADRRRFVPAAIRMFLAQDYAQKELVIVDDGADRIVDIVPSHPQIRYIELAQRESLGAKRNLACRAAGGEIILHWDDDDWYAPWRIRYQVDHLEAGDFDLCGIDRALFIDCISEQAWEYVYSQPTPRWVCGAALCYKKSFWQRHGFSAVNSGEDTRFVFSAKNARLGVQSDNRFFVARIHAANTCRKDPRGRRWEPRSFEAVRSLVGRDWQDCFTEDTKPPRTICGRTGSALVSAASGIGDVLRVTPLIRAASRLNYYVDVLLSPDDPEVLGLLRGAPEIRHLWSYGELLRAGARTPAVRIQHEPYDFATFTVFSAPLAAQVRARTFHTFDRSWRHQGDIASIEKIAREIGWQGDLPAPFAVKSTRNFDLPSSTIALHPGCKPGWPWKKWHGFDELAALFPNVALIGTPPDLDNTGTYFARPFRWPKHVQNFIGKLDLRDTAALISQCAALISVDSGMMHLGVALCIPTFGIFGVTSPKRECMPSPYMMAISGQLPCEPACRRRPWGRRDCRQRLACLKTLTPEGVAARVATAFRFGI